MMNRLFFSTRCVATVVLAASLFAIRAAHAQQPAPPSRRHVEVAVTYSASRANVTDGSSFWAQGGAAEGSFTVAHHFSAVANFNGSHSGSAATSQSPFSLLTLTFGPRYTWAVPRTAKRRHPADIFGQGLFGLAHEFDSALPSASSASSFALQLGGGVDVGLTPRFSLRAIEADWIRTQLPNATTGAQNSLRLATGFIYRF